MTDGDALTKVQEVILHMLWRNSSYFAFPQNISSKYFLVYFSKKDEYREDESDFMAFDGVVLHRREIGLSCFA